MTDTGTVSYTVKELLARQDGKLDSIIMSLSGKAEKSEVDRISVRMDIVERTQASSTGSANTLWRFAPLLVACASLALAAAVWVKP